MPDSPVSPAGADMGASEGLTDRAYSESFNIAAALSGLSVAVFVLFYILFCHVWLFSIRSLFFSSERQKGHGSRGEGRGSGEELGGVEEGELQPGYIVEKRVYCQ